MKDNEIRKLLEKHMQNKCTPEEEKVVHAWLDDNDGIANSMDFLTSADLDAKEQRIWHKLATNLWGNSQPSFVRKRRIGGFYLMKIAVSIILLIGTVIYVNTYRNGIFWWNGTRYHTGYGEVKEISLPDGSVITLNAMSELKVTKRYGRDTRELFLTGEAYFKVKSDTSNPFVVYAKELATQALGTEFNISAYPEGKKTTVSLIKGKVEVRNRSEGQVVEVTLSPGEEAEMEKGNILKREEFSDVERIGWRTDKLLVFKDADIDEVLQKLRRYYGVKFDYSAVKKRDWKLTGQYKEQSLIEVMESLAFNYNIDFKITGDKVILTAKKEEKSHEIN